MAWELSRFYTAGMGRTGFEPGRGRTNCGLVCVRPLLGVSGPCEGTTRLVGVLACICRGKGSARPRREDI
jgi:hypothetical protein